MSHGVSDYGGFTVCMCICMYVCTVTSDLSDTGLSRNLIYLTLHCESLTLNCTQFYLIYPTPGLPNTWFTQHLVYPTPGLSNTWFTQHLVYPTPGLSNNWFIQHLVYPTPGLSDTFMENGCRWINEIPHVRTCAHGPE